MKAKKKLLSPGRIFIFYILAAGLSIIVFRFLVPGDPEPLPIYARSWRLTQGLLNFISLFPALAMTGLVIPFGLQKQKEEQYPRFSPQLLDQFKGPIITAISAVVCYGVLFFWVFPLVQDYETKLLVEGNLFTRSKEKALEYAEKSAWPEVSQLIATCERIWPESPELESIKTEAAIGMDQWRITQATVRAYALAEEEYHFNDDWISEHSEERKPVTVAEALVLANTALKEMRYYDAHWLANLGLRLASQNSREAREAAGIASRAWDGITRVESSLRDTDEAALYHLKRDGYDAMNSEDWIRAYYLFKEFFVKRPGDPDVARFLPISEQGIAKVAFFTDEMELTVGEDITNALFSIPLRFSSEENPGRVVLHLSSLSTFSEVSFGTELELISFDGAGNLLYRVTAPYVKILPMTIDSEPKLFLMMRALDRSNQAIQWEPVWTDLEQSETENTQLLLDLSYEHFLMLSKLMRGLSALSVVELFIAAQQFGAYGYISQVFQAEIIYRLAEFTSLLPIAIFVIVMGWRYRAKKQSWYLGIPMLAVLPLVFNEVVFFYQRILNTIGMWAVISFGFSAAISIFVIGTLFFFVLALITLAAQKA